jgi:hypothetical protein
MNYWEPSELIRLEQDEQQTRLALEAAKERNRLDDGEDPGPHHEHIHKLEQEWKQALERLHLARRHAED